MNSILTEVIINLEYLDIVNEAGHIPAGDEPVESALRELQEELGINAEPSDLNYAGMFRIQYEKSIPQLFVPG